MGEIEQYENIKKCLVNMFIVGRMFPEKIYQGFYFESNFFLSRKKIIFDEVIEIIKNLSLIHI